MEAEYARKQLSLQLETLQSELKSAKSAEKEVDPEERAQLLKKINELELELEKEITEK